MEDLFPAVAGHQTNRYESDAQQLHPHARKFAEGERAMTLTGRMTTPFPRIDLSSDRKAKNTLDRIAHWLVDNAVAEAWSRNDKFNQREFESINSKRITQAEKDSINIYIFDNTEGPLDPARHQPSPFNSRVVDREAFIYTNHGLSSVGIVSDATIFSRRERDRIALAEIFVETEDLYSTLSHGETGFMNGFRGPDQWDVKKHLRQSPPYVIVNGHRLNDQAWKFLIFLAETDMRRDRGYPNIYSTLNHYENGMLDASLNLPIRPFAYGGDDYAKGRAENEANGPKCKPTYPKELRETDGDLFEQETLVVQPADDQQGSWDDDVALGWC